MKERYYALDSIRGIAAFIVVLSHCYSVLPSDVRERIYWLKEFPLILRNGPAAVIVFFVLSGFVLALPYFSGRAPTYQNFLLRRMCRIYIPFVAAILLSCLLFALTDHTLTGAGDYAEKAWGHQKLSLPVISGHLLMTGIAQNIFLDGPMWSLVHELRVALIFPLLIPIFTHRGGGITFIILFSLLALFATWHYGSFIQFPIVTNSFASTFLATACLLPTFMLGILLAQNLEAIRGLLMKIGNRWQNALWLLILAVFSVFDSYDQTVILSGAAAAIIMLTLSSKTASIILMTKPLQWLGKISYSLYLTHLPVMMALVCVLRGYLDYGWIDAIALPVTLGVAELMCRYVEIPAIKLGKFITR